MEASSAITASDFYHPKRVGARINGDHFVPCVREHMSEIEPAFRFWLVWYWLVCCFCCWFCISSEENAVVASRVSESTSDASASFEKKRCLHGSRPKKYQFHTQTPELPQQYDKRCLAPVHQTKGSPGKSPKLLLHSDISCPKVLRRHGAAVRLCCASTTMFY